MVSLSKDEVSEILTHCPMSAIEKFRVLNKEYYRISYESAFLKLQCRRTDSLYGYFAQNQSWNYKYYSDFYSFDINNNNNNRGTQLSLDFLPSGERKIEACDSSKGILLCVNEFPATSTIPQFIVCKPSTKQYRFIPRPKLRYSTQRFGLMVVQTNPFQYKILRLSRPSSSHDHRLCISDMTYSIQCEIFCSDSWAWKRIPDFHLPWMEFISDHHSNPVSSFGSFYWITTKNNVFEFLLKTETWSLFELPQELLLLSGNSHNHIQLVKYQGKLGVVCLRWNKSTEEGFVPMWVLKDTSKRLWVKVKILKAKGLLEEEDSFLQIWFHSSDVVTLATYDSLSFYNVNSEKHVKVRLRKLFAHLFSFYSDSEKVDLMGPNEYKAQKSISNAL